MTRRPASFFVAFGVLPHEAAEVIGRRRYSPALPRRPMVARNTQPELNVLTSLISPDGDEAGLTCSYADQLNWTPSILPRRQITVQRLRFPPG
jgi:hypothetical protein